MKKFVILIAILIAMVAMPTLAQADSKQSDQTSKVPKVDHMDPKFFSPIFDGGKLKGWSGVAIDSCGCLWIFAESADSAGRIVAKKDKDHVHVLVKLPRKHKKVVFVFRGVGTIISDKGVHSLPAGIIIENGSDKYIDLTYGRPGNALALSFPEEVLVGQEVSVQTFLRVNLDPPKWWKKEKDKPDYIIRFQ